MSPTVNIQQIFMHAGKAVRHLWILSNDKILRVQTISNFLNSSNPN